jgi:hypothetical protein
MAPAKLFQRWATKGGGHCQENTTGKKKKTKGASIGQPGKHIKKEWKQLVNSHHLTWWGCGTM